MSTSEEIKAIDVIHPGVFSGTKELIAAMKAITEYGTLDGKVRDAFLEAIATLDWMLPKMQRLQTDVAALDGIGNKYLNTLAQYCELERYAKRLEKENTRLKILRDLARVCTGNASGDQITKTIQKRLKKFRYEIS